MTKGQVPQFMKSFYQKGKKKKKKGTNNPTEKWRKELNNPLTYVKYIQQPSKDAQGHSYLGMKKSKL